MIMYLFYVKKILDYGFYINCRLIASKQYGSARLKLKKSSVSGGDMRVD